MSSVDAGRQQKTAQGLDQMRAWLLNSYGSFDEFKIKISEQISSGRYDPSVIGYINQQKERIAEALYEPATITGDFEEIFRDTSFAAMAGGLEYLSTYVPPSPSYSSTNPTTGQVYVQNPANMNTNPNVNYKNIAALSKGIMYGAGTVAIGSAVYEVYRSEDPFNETKKQSTMMAASYLAAKLSAGPASLLALTFVPNPLGAVIAVAAATAAVGGSAAALVGYLWDEAGEEAQRAKSEGLTEQEAFDLALQKFLSEAVEAYRHPLSRRDLWGDESPFSSPGEQNDINQDRASASPTRVEEAEEGFEDSEISVSPLIFDLNGNGRIDLVSLSASHAYFELTGDAMAENTGWLDGASGDGFLVWDRNGDGIVNGISELFGSQTNEGFSELALLDSNSDGVIDARDGAFSDLQIWVDANGNAIPSRMSCSRSRTTRLRQSRWSTRGYRRRSRAT